MSKIKVFGALVLAVLFPVLTLADAPLYSAYVAGSAVNATAAINPLVGQSSCAFDLENTFVATVTFKGLVNSTWVPLPATPVGVNGTASTTASSPGIYTANCSSLLGVEAVVTSYTSGEVDMSINSSAGQPPTYNQSVTVTNFPATQPISAASAVPVSGSVSVSNFPSTQAVTGTFYPPTQPVSIATLPPLAAGSASIGSVTVTTMPTAPPASYTIIKAAATTVIKSSPGVFYGAVNLSGATAQTNTYTCYDNASAASGTIINSTTLPVNGNQVFPFGVAFKNGLTCSVTTALAGNGVALYWL